MTKLLLGVTLLMAGMFEAVPPAHSPQRMPDIDIEQVFPPSLMSGFDVLLWCYPYNTNNPTCYEL